MQPHGREPAGRLDRPALGDIAGLVHECTLCRLCHARRGAIFGGGDESADLMFVCEAPGYHEDAAGELFPGAAGELFHDLLASINMTRSEVYVTSVVKCRPPRNRTPFPDEVEQCEGYLFKQVTMVRPAVICALGNVAIQLLTGKPHSLSRVHGSPFRAAVQARDVLIYPLYHPGATLGHAGLRRELEDDFRALPRLLRGEPLAEGVRVATQPAAPAAVPAGIDEQGERWHAADAGDQLAPPIGADDGAAPASKQATAPGAVRDQQAEARTGPDEAAAQLTFNLG